MQCKLIQWSKDGALHTATIAEELVGRIRRVPARCGGGRDMWQWEPRLDCSFAPYIFHARTVQSIKEGIERRAEEWIRNHLRRDRIERESKLAEMKARMP